jgi:hypothetical protein
LCFVGIGVAELPANRAFSLPILNVFVGTKANVGVLYLPSDDWGKADLMRAG